MKSIKIINKLLILTAILAVGASSAWAAADLSLTIRLNGAPATAAGLVTGATGFTVFSGATSDECEAVTGTSEAVTGTTFNAGTGVLAGPDVLDDGTKYAVCAGTNPLLVWTTEAQAVNKTETQNWYTATFGFTGGAAPTGSGLTIGGTYDGSAITAADRTVQGDENKINSGDKILYENAKVLTVTPAGTKITDYSVTWAPTAAPTGITAAETAPVRTYTFGATAPTGVPATGLSLTATATKYVPALTNPNTIAIKFYDTEAAPRHGTTVASVSATSAVTLPADDKEGFTVDTVIWRDENDAYNVNGRTFVAGTVYLAKVRLKAAAGYIFKNATTSASFWTGAETGPVGSRDTVLFEVKHKFTAIKKPIQTETLVPLAVAWPVHGDDPTDYTLGLHLFNDLKTDEFNIKSVAWTDASDAEITANTNFVGGLTYTLTVILQPTTANNVTGYTFTGYVSAAGAGDAEDFFKGASGSINTTENNANEGNFILKYKYTVEETVIARGDKDGILKWTTPAVDKKQTSAAALGYTDTTTNGSKSTADGYTLGTTISWRDATGATSASGPFVGGTSYTAIVTLAAKTGYRFNTAMTSNDAATFGLPGATVSSVSAVQLKLAVPVTALKIVSLTKVDGVVGPVTGALADTTLRVTETEQFTGRISDWLDDGNTPASILGDDPVRFESGAVYSVKIKLTPKAGFTFIDYPNASIIKVGTLTATKGSLQDPFELTVTYPRTNFTGDEVASAIAAQITWATIQGGADPVTSVKSDLNLSQATAAILGLAATVGNPGVNLNDAEKASVSIVWDSNRKDVISDAGKVTRPSADADPIDVTFKALVTSSLGGSDQATFSLKVEPFATKADEDLGKVVAALTWDAIKGAADDVQTKVTKSLRLPVDGQFAGVAEGIKIDWTLSAGSTPSSVFSIIPDTSADGFVTAQVVRETAKDFDVSLTPVVTYLPSQPGPTIPAFNLKLVRKGEIAANAIVFRADSAVYNRAPQGIGPASIDPAVANDYAGSEYTTTYTYVGTNFPSSTTPPTNQGTYNVTVTFENAEFFGSKTVTWKITRKNIEGVTVALEGGNDVSFEYTGTSHTPSVTQVRDGATLLAASTEYTVSHANNVNAGLGVVRITGVGNYTGVDSLKTFPIAKKALTITSGSLSPATKVYDGSDTATGVVSATFTGTVLGQTILAAQYKVVDAKYNSPNVASADSVKGVVVLDTAGSVSRNYRLASDTVTVKSTKITKRNLAAADFVWFYNDSLNASVPTGHRAGRATVGAGEPRLKSPLSGETSALTALYTVRANVDSVDVPNAAGSYPVSVRLKDAVAVASSNYNVAADSTVKVAIGSYVISDPKKPEIATQPKDTTVRVGGTVTVSVGAVTPDSAIGGVVSYQWYKNSAVIAGATSASYSEPANTTVGAKDTFYVFVRNAVAGIQLTDSLKSANAIITTLKAAVSIAFADVEVDTQYTYSGKPQVPPASKVKVILDGVTLVNGADYTFKTRDSLNAGTASVLVEGIHDYKDVAEGTYRINKKMLEKGDLMIDPKLANYNTLPQAVRILVTDKDGAARTGLGKETIWYANTDTTKDTAKTIAAPVEAGEYAITVTVANNGLNFTGTPVDSSFDLGVYTVRQKAVEVSDILLNGEPFVGPLPNHLYTGDTLGIGVVTLKGTNDGEAEIVYVRNNNAVAPVEAGLYTVRVNISGYNNYRSVTFPLGTYTIAGPAELVAAAKARIEAATFGPVTDSAVNTAAKAKAYVEGVIEELELGEVTAVVSGTFTAATDSTAGSYVFTVALSVGSATETTVAKTVAIGQKVSIASNDRVIPGTPTEVVVVAPVQVVAGEFTVGPNPVAKASGKVGFFWQGKAVKSGTLYVFDASGNLVAKAAVSDKGTGTDRREIGSWNLTANGAPVAEGTYLVKGVLVGKDGSKVKVSSILSVAR